MAEEQRANEVTLPAALKDDQFAGVETLRKRKSTEMAASKLLKEKFKPKRGRPTRGEAEERKQALVEAGFEVEELTDLLGSKSLKRKRNKKNKVLLSQLTGKTVEGIVDGSFDAGYFLTVKVADSDIFLRGVVFSPSKSVPVTRYNDIAVGVNSVEPKHQNLAVAFPPFHQIDPVKSVQL